jgi:serine protease
MKSHHRSRARLDLEQLEVRDVPSSTAGEFITSSSNYSAGDILVRWLNNSPVNTNLSTGYSALGNNTYSVALNSGVSVASAVAYYQTLAGVQFAQPDYSMSLDGVPNDPGFGLQWNLQNTGQNGGTAGDDISAVKAWNLTTGSKNIIVAVIDTGVDFTHPDLAANMWHNPTENTDGIAGDLYGADFSGSTPTGNPMDYNGHGTNVASIIGAVGNNGIGITGVDPNVQIMALKFTDNSGNGTDAHAIEAIYFAVNHGAKILNDSWGAASYDSALSSAILYAQQHGVIFVASAGNNGTNNDVTPFYPADYQYGNTVSVAATDNHDNLASFSNYGPRTVSIAAPGVTILGAYPTTLDATNPYRYYSGTSQAAPQVAGALALVWSIHPTWNYSQVISDVLNSADAMPGVAGKVESGILDVYKALENAMPASLSVTQASWSGNSATTLSHVQVTFSSAINPSTLNANTVKLTNPSGQSVSFTRFTAVSGSNNQAFDIYFTPQMQIGKYSLTVGPNVLDLFGRPMSSAYASTDSIAASPPVTNPPVSTPPVASPPAANPPAASASGRYYSGNVNVAIRDQNTVSAAMAISTHLSIRYLTVKINISDTFDGGLIVKLVSPSGQTVVLSDQRGGSGRGFSFTTFADSASTAIAAGQAPFSGIFRPDGSLSNLNGSDLYGTWTLLVTETAGKTVGTIQNFTITAQGSAIAGSATKVAGEEVAIFVPILTGAFSPAAAPAANGQAGQTSLTLHQPGAASVADVKPMPANPSRPNGQRVTQGDGDEFES